VLISDEQLCGECDIRLLELSAVRRHWEAGSVSQGLGGIVCFIQQVTGGRRDRILALTFPRVWNVFFHTWSERLMETKVSISLLCVFFILYDFGKSIMDPANTPAAENDFGFLNRRRAFYFVTIMTGVLVCRRESFS
jgi:hypothetical protein